MASDLVRAVLAAALGTLRLYSQMQIAVGGVERLDDGARFHQVHHAVMNDGNGFAGAGSQAARPRHAELADVRTIHLLQRAEALRVVGAAVHQPVVRTGTEKHVLCHRDEILHHLRLGAGGQHHE